MTKDVNGLGRNGDVREVSDGYARNYLIPQHLALPATTSLLQKMQKETAEYQARLKKEQEYQKQLGARLHQRTITIKAKADKQHLFASIKPEQISQAIEDQLKVKIEPSALVVKEPIKSLGLHELKIRFASDTVSLVKLKIEAK